VTVTADLSVRDPRGHAVAVPVARWFGAIGPVDLRVLARAEGPVLDVGCGPGRHVVALAERGIPALGIDVTSMALDVARRRGACVIERSVFDRVPAAGRWSTVLLLDGNVGIGGEPVALLRRVRDLLRPGGSVIVELEAGPIRHPSRLVRFELAGTAGPWFRLSSVTVGELDDLAAESGFTTTQEWREGARGFAVLVRRDTT
jgi:SAM-dependent methyltransferase